MVMVQGTNCIFTPRWRQQCFETVVDSVIGLGRTFANAQSLNFVSCICIMYCCVGVVPKKFRSRSSDPPCPSVFRFADKDAGRLGNINILFHVALSGRLCHGIIVWEEILKIVIGEVFNDGEEFFEEVSDEFKTKEFISSTLSRFCICICKSAVLLCSFNSRSRLVFPCCIFQYLCSSFAILILVSCICIWICKSLSTYPILES